MERLKVLRIVCLLCLFVPRVSVAQIFTHTSSPYGAQVPAATMRSTSSMRGSAASYSGARVSRSTYGTAGTMRTGGSYSAASTAYAGTKAYRPSANVQGFYTAASAVRGGVTAADVYSPRNGSGRRGVRASAPDEPDPVYEDACPYCHWVWNEEAGCYICSGCGAEDWQGDCDCDEYGGCRCPIGDGWDVWIMLAVMAISYVLFMRRRVKSE